jgi:hypothetical protein
MENQDQFFITIFVGVKYENKDLAKEQGAKWDKDSKKWYFKYPLQEFLDDDTKHTYQFKPFSIGVSISYATKYGEVERMKEIQRCYYIASKRNAKYTTMY